MTRRFLCSAFTAGFRHQCRFWLLTGLLLSTLAPVLAQVAAVRVKDINPTGRSSPDPGIKINGVYYFTANDGVHGVELWRTDNTEAGTVLVKDIHPSGSADPEELINVNGTLFFRADDGSGNELWKSDGTEAGTVRVKKIGRDGYSGSYPHHLVNLNGTLFFGADDHTVVGEDLWKSDGTEAGTVRVKDLNPGGRISSSSDYNLTIMNGMIYFSVYDDKLGSELWKSDGTEAGTVLVKDINPSGSSNPREFVVSSNILYFEANDGSSGQEVWKSDGTAAGTVLLKDINPDGDSQPEYLVDVNGTLFFTANQEFGPGYIISNELWKSDGTEAGTVLVKVLNPTGNSLAEFLTNVNGTLFFAGTDASGKQELWKSDGTAEGTVLVKLTRPQGDAEPEKFTAVDGTLFVSMRNEHGRNLYRSDGTEAGTVEVGNIVSLSGAYPMDMVNADGTLYFSAYDQVDDRELYRTVFLTGITRQPVSGSVVCAGATVTAAVSVTGSEPMTYQWYKDGVSLAGQQTATLNVSNAQLSDAGSYAVVVTGFNSVTSTAFSLTVNAETPAPVFQASASTLPILQNTPFVSLTLSGCEGGTMAWSGSNATKGTGTTIPVPTSATGTLVYSATCTVGNCTSPLGSATIVVASPLVTGSFDGFVNGADCGSFRGWAWDRNKPNNAVSVDILDGSNVIATLNAGDYRQDLKDAGKGNGSHAFRYTIPQFLKDGLPHNLSARVNGSSFLLKDSPKALICEGVPVPGGNKAPIPPSPTPLIAPLMAQVGVAFSGTLVAFTDPEGSSLSYALSGLPDGLAINASSRVISGIPTEAGSFVLTYSASDGQLTNSVSFPLTVNPASTTTVAGSFEGYLDKVECGTIRGWVWDRKLPNTPLTVEFYQATTQQVFGSVVANIYRDDLKNAGKGNGAHAYSFTVPDELKDGNPRAITARVLGSTYDLKGGPKVLTCNPSPARLSAESSAGLQVTVLGNPVLDQLSVEVKGAEGQPLRLRLTDASGRLVSQRQLETASATEQLLFRVNEQPAGLLLLWVNSGLKHVELKILKQ